MEHEGHASQLSPKLGYKTNVLSRKNIKQKFYKRNKNDIRFLCSWEQRSFMEILLSETPKVRSKDIVLFEGIIIKRLIGKV